MARSYKTSTMVNYNSRADTGGWTVISMTVSFHIVLVHNTGWCLQPFKTKTKHLKLKTSRRVMWSKTVKIRQIWQALLFSSRSSRLFELRKQNLLIWKETRRARLDSQTVKRGSTIGLLRPFGNSFTPYPFVVSIFKYEPIRDSFLFIFTTQCLRGITQSLTINGTSVDVLRIRTRDQMDLSYKGSVVLNYNSRVT